MRTIVDIPQNQLDALNIICEQENISRAEAVRRAIAVFLHKEENHKPKKKHKKSSIDAAFGIWKDLNIDGLEYQRKLREEW